MKSLNQIVIDALHIIVSSPEHDENKISQYFSPDYQQVVDGNSLNYDDFLMHMAALKSQTKRMNVAIKTIVAENNIVFTHHYVSVEKCGGEQSEFEVFACFTLSLGRIIRCEELTRMISGGAGDRDFGSRR